MRTLFRVDSDFIPGAKVQKIFGICKNLINFIRLIVRAERDKTFWRAKMVRNGKKEQARQYIGAEETDGGREGWGGKPDSIRQNGRSEKADWQSAQ